MPPFTPQVSESVQVDPDCSLNLEPMAAIRIVGCLVLFIVFCFVAHKMCCAPPSSTSDGQSFPSYQHKHQYSPARIGRTSPTASMPKCLTCQKTNAHTMADKPAQSPPRSTRPAAPYSPRMHGPTGVGPRPQSCRPAQAPSSAPLNTTPTTPLSPPLRYGARGPTANLRPVVW